MVSTPPYYPGVIGAGSFGTAIANILAENGPVILLARKPETLHAILQHGVSSGQKLHSNVTVTGDWDLLTSSCNVLFPIVPSTGFVSAMESLKHKVTQHHILIHGTKGLFWGEQATDLSQIKTMSAVMQSITGVERVGCLAGPNLAREIAEGKPAATVIAANHPEVIDAGMQLLRSPRFQVLGSNDLLGVELCGVLKNMIAIAAGALTGLDLGENAKALLVNRGMVEMIHIGQNMGAGIKAFLGVAGIGDLMATCNSPKSRNFTVGLRLAQGESLHTILHTMDEPAEGVNTIRIVHHLSEQHQWKTPITKMLYKVLFEQLPVRDALPLLMKLPLKEDIDFI